MVRPPYDYEVPSFLLSLLLIHPQINVAVSDDSIEVHEGGPVEYTARQTPPFTNKIYIMK